MSDLVSYDPKTLLWAFVIFILTVVFLCGFALARDRAAPGLRLGYSWRSEDEPGYSEWDAE